MRTSSSKVKKSVAAAVLAVLIGASPAYSDISSLETDLMPYPFWTAPLEGDIYHVPTGMKFSFDAMMDLLASARVVYVGEAHDNIHSHRMQLDIIRDLHGRFPGRIAVGMEMFREPQQASLDRWTAGELSEATFLKDSRWYENWSMNFGYYRDILNFTRVNRIDVIALNPPMELQRAVGMSGSKVLTPDMARALPETDSSDPYQRAIVEAAYKAHEGGERLQDAFLRIQLLWEENMAERIVEYLGGPEGEGKIMVVIAGGTHVKYGVGIPKKVLRRMPMSYFVVLPALLDNPAQEAQETEHHVIIEKPDIPLLSGDFIWSVPYENLVDRKVLLGIRMTVREDGVGVRQVIDNSPAMLAGILPGDLLVSLDDLVIEGMRDVKLVIGTKQVGDSLSVVVRRDDKELLLSANFTEPAG